MHVFLKVGVLFHSSFFHFDKAGPVENRVEYRIPEASGGSVNVCVICCNARKAAYRRPPAALSMSRSVSHTGGLRRPCQCFFDLSQCQRSFFFILFFHFDNTGLVANRVQYRILEASGGLVNVFLIWCNARKAAYRRPPAALSMFF